MKSRQSGFTLVEIAIVLVIIGLLLGGVLKGQELINSAKIKNLVNDMNGISTAVYAYQDRFKALPGDDTNAATRWASSTGVTFPLATASTLGDTQVTGAFDSNVAATESVAFWDELRLAGFLGGSTGQTVVQPQNAVGGIVGVQTGVGVQGVGAATGLSGLVVCQTNLSGRIAEALDNQLDDGKPDSGAVKAFLQGTAGTGTLVGTSATTSIAADRTPATSFVDDGNTLYTMCKKIT
ncbi:MAG: prepilin-type N-terminal cleavage/methylation domain-containing protein [Sulfuritalea sp.]|nr:prepilin-type N-terminal cleavage/methylation domain-containing protein [Sulfuritalea sp.]MDP1983953.1 prepilin-type N-terminal cleavage/methylation domain-containing protein [Sulfuritalea sp.]